MAALVRLACRCHTPCQRGLSACTYGAACWHVALREAVGQMWLPHRDVMMMFVAGVVVATLRMLA